MPSRTPDHPVDPLFLERWSPRAFDASTMPDADLMTLFEAARWAPSAFNSQPGRFLYAKRGDENWQRFLSLLIPWNQSWAHSASVLVYIVSDTLPFTDKASGAPARSTTHSFDAGAAWACLALQATKMGYQAHGMSGIQYELARADPSLDEVAHPVAIKSLPFRKVEVHAPPRPSFPMSGLAARNGGFAPALRQPGSPACRR